MNPHQQGEDRLGFPITVQQSLREREEEARKIRRLQLMISMITSVISQDPNLMVEEALNWLPERSAPPSLCFLISNSPTICSTSRACKG